MILSLDRDVGEFTTGDVLIEGDKILAVGPGLVNGDSEVIDASGMIVMPGFVDSHRHIWEGLLRNIGTDVPLEGRTSYISFILHKLAPAYRPEDAYVGNLVSAVGAINAGITTLLDWSHIQASPAHTDAVIQALKDSGLRAIFAYGFPWWGKWEERQPSWFVRAATEYFSSKDQMLTLALAAPGPEFTDFEVARDHWKLARETGARITTHVGVGTYGQERKVQEMGEAGLLGPDTTYIHCTTLNDTEIQMIVDSGGSVSLASPVEMMMGHGMPPIQKFLDRGLAPTLSIDVETNVPSDMFNQMRSVLGLQRALAAAEGKAAGLDPRRPGWATIEGARANGLESKVGTLTPGKQADLIMLRTDRLNVTPLNDPATAVVAGMDTSNVDSVFIAGRAMKRDGKLLHVDWNAVMKAVSESRDWLDRQVRLQAPADLGANSARSGRRRRSRPARGDLADSRRESRRRSRSPRGRIRRSNSWSRGPGRRGADGRGLLRWDSTMVMPCEMAVAMKRRPSAAMARPSGRCFSGSVQSTNSFSFVQHTDSTGIGLDPHEPPIGRERQSIRVRRWKRNQNLAAVVTQGEQSVGGQRRSLGSYGSEGSVKYRRPSGPNTRSFGACKGTPATSVVTVVTSPASEIRSIDGVAGVSALHSSTTPPF